MDILREHKKENEYFVSGKTSVIGVFQHVNQIFDQFDTFKFSALGQGIDKLLWIVEIIKVKNESNV